MLEFKLFYIVGCCDNNNPPEVEKTINDYIAEADAAEVRMLSNCYGADIVIGVLRRKDKP